MLLIVAGASAGPVLDLPKASAGGREVLAKTASNGEARSKDVADALIAGNIPARQREMRPIRFDAVDGRNQPRKVVVWVTPDYLEVGTNRDAVYAPLDLPNAQRVARALSAILPTSRLSDAIHAADVDPLEPQPIPPHPGMVTTGTLLRHQAMIEGFVVKASGDGLATGHKKDLVLTRALYKRPDRVAIYGWHHPDGTPIQPVSLWHGERYVDYSHGVRLVAREMEVDGQPMDILDVLGDPELAPLISDEGPLESGLLDAWR